MHLANICCQLMPDSVITVRLHRAGAQSRRAEAGRLGSRIKYGGGGKMSPSWLLRS